MRHPRKDWVQVIRSSLCAAGGRSGSAIFVLMQEMALKPKRLVNVGSPTIKVGNSANGTVTMNTSLIGKTMGAGLKNIENEAGQIASYPRNQDEYFKPCVSWSKISSGRLAFRYKPAGSIFNEVAPAFFSDKSSSFKFEAFLNSSVCAEVAKAVSPTLDFQVGQVASYPVLHEVLESSQTPAIVESLTVSSCNDWDSFEISYGFKRHPLA